MSVSLNTPKCEHCGRMMAFGTFRVSLARGGTKLMALCADCGFNLPNFAVGRLAQIKDRDWLGNLAPKEFMYRFYPYKSCTLIEVFSEAQKQMMAIHVAELKEQQHQKLSKRAPRQPMLVREPSAVTPRRTVAS